VGFDAYQKVVQTDVHVVLLTAPPHWRAQHFQAAVQAGKHVFMEKPAGVDPAGIRSVLKSAELAAQKRLGIVAGTQRRHDAGYVEIMRRIHDGAIGDLVSAGAYWMGDYSYYQAVLKKPEWSDMEWQLRNWNYFTWLSGDHVVEQHVHNIDIMNWALKSPPVKCIATGGRQQRTAPEFGHIFDHFAIEFEYPGGVRVTSLSRQQANVSHRVSEFLAGTQGKSDASRSIWGETNFKYEGKVNNPYVQEHADLIAGIRGGTPLNEGQAVAESTLAAIMGRMAAYTGREINWQWVLNASKLDLAPPKYEFGPLPVPPVAIPGQAELV
jgi:predicted dehydrogenase